MYVHNSANCMLFEIITSGSRKEHSRALVGGLNDESSTYTRSGDFVNCALLSDSVFRIWNLFLGDEAKAFKL